MDDPVAAIRLIGEVLLALVAGMMLCVDDASTGDTMPNSCSECASR
jgi:hypothetical protein